MYKSVIENIEQVQRSRISSISISKSGKTNIAGPPKGCAGLYFFYTSYSISDIAACGDVPTRSAVPMADLASKLGNLNCICKEEDTGFRLVYNGIGGYSGSSYDLRTRILQEISTTDHRTGSLCIRQTSLNDLSKWRYSYVIMPTRDSESKEESDLQQSWFFETEALNLERFWRFHYGWPLLSRG